MKILNKSIKQPEIATFWPPDETAPSQLNCELDIRAGWESKLLKHVPIQLDSFKKQDLGQQTKILAKISFCGEWNFSVVFEIQIPNSTLRRRMFTTSFHRLKNMWNLSKILRILNLSTYFEWWFRVESGVMQQHFLARGAAWLLHATQTQVVWSYFQWICIDAIYPDHQWV